MFKDIYGLFIVKASAKAVDSTDNLFISIFLGTIIVGLNSNYLLFFAAASSVVSIIIYSFSASVGDYNVEKGKKDVEALFRMIDSFNFIISFAFSLFLFSFLNPFIGLLWGREYLFDFKTVCVICFYFYLTTSLHTVYMFRSSLGLFRKYRYFFVLCALMNLILDYFFVQWMGVFGLYLASALANLIFAVVPFVKSLYSGGFGLDYKAHVVKIFIRYAIVCGFAFLVFSLTQFLPMSIEGFLIRVAITVVVVFVGVLGYALFSKSGARVANYVLSYVKGRRQKNEF